MLNDSITLLNSHKSNEAHHTPTIPLLGATVGRTSKSSRRRRRRRLSTTRHVLDRLTTIRYAFNASLQQKALALLDDEAVLLPHFIVPPRDRGNKYNIGQKIEW